MPQLPDWLFGVHHDGSECYVSNPLPAFGEQVTLRLRTPYGAPLRRVWLRYTPDGEGRYNEMKPVRTTRAATWWETPLAITMPANPYHFKLLTDDAAYYVNSLGAQASEPLSLFDFTLLADYQAPLWVQDSVFYHIFVDRFYNGDPDNDVPPGAWSMDGFTTQRRAWDQPPLPWSEGGNLDFYGGDLPGIAQKLDYLRDLGVNTVALTPIFTARTNHRYDTIDFDHVDPFVGGDSALAALREALDRHSMHIALDVVVNHLGAAHPWFTTAQRDPKAPTADYFTFYEHPHRYATWLGINSLVKLNFNSEGLRDALYRAPESILRRWLRPPYRIDSWRMDVFHMMARQGHTRLEHTIGRGIRAAVKADNPQLYLYGEHSFDGTPHLQGDEVDATMNYEGFSVPLRRWLTGFMGPEWQTAENDPERMPAEAVVEQWRSHLAAIPWVIARQQYHMLSSHDMMRFLRAVSEDKALLRLAAALMMTYPGVPAVYYGDEIGMTGGSDPDNRRPFEWDQSRWDHDLRSYFQALIRLRRTAPALVHGGIQFLYAESGLIVFQRQSLEQQVIVIGWRGPGRLEGRAISIHHAGLADGDRLRDLITGESFTIADGALILHDRMPGAALLLEAARR